MFHSLQTRLTAGFVAIIAITVVSVSISVSLLYAGVLHDQYDATYRNNFRALVALLDSDERTIIFDQQVLHDSTIVPIDLPARVTALATQFHVHIRIYTLPGRQVAVESRETDPRDDQHLAPDTFGALASTPGVGYVLRQLQLPAPEIEVSRPLTDRLYQEHLFFRNVATVTLGALLLAVVLSGLLAERLTAPFRVLTGAAARVGEGNLRERVPEERIRSGRRDEAGELAHQFNRMAGQLEQSFASVSAERDRLALDRDHLRQFVADVSHELRTPLTALHTFSDLLRDGAGEIATTRDEFLDASAQQIERLEWLTRNLLDLSRLEAGMTRIDPRPDDLAETLRRAVAANRPAATTKGVVLLLDAPPLLVAHDPPRLEQALGNIVSNAVKFSPPGGTVDARLYALPGEALVEIADRGRGIPAAEAPHVFERFYRGKDANRGGEGSGLGLAIAKAIVDAHDGVIVLESTPGRGTTMRLMLPRGTPPSPSLPSVGAPS